MKAKYELNDLIAVARRLNNTKRSYLYVNPLQGKHVPVRPAVSLDVFRLLAEQIGERYAGERLLVIGFAETATAIGAAIAYYGQNVQYYMHTTRETFCGEDYVFFTESHSHATDQRLITDGLAACLPQIDRIVFAEDEVTTGNTIHKLMDALTERFPEAKLRFGIVSVLNSMTEERLAELAGEGVACDFLHRIPFGYGLSMLEDHVYQEGDTPVAAEAPAFAQTICPGHYRNARLIQEAEALRSAWDAAVQAALEQLSLPEDPKRLLVLGTEECMFQGMLLGLRIGERFPECDVRFHATTRSPIEVSAGADYPLHARYALPSLYDGERQTYLYDLACYDAAVIATDAAPLCEAGVQALLAALAECGTTRTGLVQWRTLE